MLSESVFSLEALKLRYGISNTYWPWYHGTIGPMPLVQVDLSAYVGTPIRLRWIESDDTLIGFTGWYVDDVTVANAAVCRGNLVAWSSTTP